MKDAAIRQAASLSRRVFVRARALPCHCTKAAPKKEREAERRQARSQEPRHTGKRYRLAMLRARRAPRICDVTAATRFGRARLSALHRGFRRAALGCTRFGPGRASREREERALPDHRSRLSQAPGTPTIMSRGSIPGPPGDGVCRPARRNRTRSALKSTLAKGIPQERAARLRRHHGMFVKFARSRVVEALILREFLFRAFGVCANIRRSLR